MLSAVLRSNTAVQISIQIINAFVELRKLFYYHEDILVRLSNLEKNQLGLILRQNDNENKFHDIFKALESKKLTPTQGIFFDGQIFDAYKFVSDLVRSAKKSIILIDNYVDENTISILSKKENDVKVLIFTKSKTRALELDIQKANEQYHIFEIMEFKQSHDRFLIIDDNEIYHIGASLKDLGKKWFAFSKMQIPVLELLEKI